MRRVLRSAFWDRYLPSVEQGWFEPLAPCLAAPHPTKDSGDLRPLLDTIAAHQRFAGKREPLPKSLRKLLGIQECRRREREVLRARQAVGALDSAAQARLLRLENDSAASPHAAKIRRAAEESFLLLGIERMDAVIRHLAAAMCRTHLGGLIEFITPDRYWDFALWIGAMNESQRERLREVIVAHDRHGREYKRHLAENHEWIGQALARGVDLDKWFAAEPQVVVMGGRTMEIALVGEVRHVFLIGAYFHTCLSLGDCNEMSVLANAYDANKQVVFMFTEDGAGRRQVVARQLIAVSSDYKLVGYCCYLNSRGVGALNRQEVETAMAAYCGGLAAQCRLELADEGAPQAIGDHFWYDDGAREWPAAARLAWAEAAVRKACQERRMVRFTRRFEKAAIRGYVLDVGPCFFLLALVSEHLWFDGFECFCIADVSDVGPDPYSAFAESALQKRGEQMPLRREVKITSIDELLWSASLAFPLVTIHREQVDPHVCHIGRVVGIGQDKVSLLEIGPDASWDAEPTTYRLSEITRVSFGGDYEGALHLVGGEPTKGERPNPSGEVAAKRKLGAARKACEDVAATEVAEVIEKCG